MLYVAGMLFIALGIGHTITGIILYRRALTGLLRDGYANAVLRSSDRLLVFWFLMFSVLLVLFGQVTLHAAATGDHGLLRMVGWYALGVGVVGAAALPKSPFWVAVLLAPVLLWSGYAA